MRQTLARKSDAKTRSMAYLHNHDWPKVRNAKCPQPRFTAVRAQQSSSCISVSRLLPINIEVEIVTKSPEARSNRTAETSASESTSAAAATLAQESKMRGAAAAAAAADAAAASQARLLQGTGRETLALDCQHRLAVAATAASLRLSL